MAVIFAYVCEIASIFGHILVVKGIEKPKFTWSSTGLFLGRVLASFAKTKSEDFGNALDETVQQTFWALVPPIIAIALALATKEVYSSLFIGIVAGGLLYSGFSFEGTVNHVFQDGVIAVLSDSYNVGILVFRVILGVN